MPHLTTDDGVKLYYEEVGSGIPIVFVHEFAGDVRSYETADALFRPALSLHRVQRARLSAVRRARRRRSYSQERARDDIRAVLDALHIDKAHIVGFSMGGFAALHFGFTYPERARSLVVAGCGYGAQPDKRAQFAAEAEAAAKQFEQHSMAKVGGGLRARPDPRAIPKQRPSRLAGVRRRNLPSTRRKARRAPCAASRRGVLHSSTWSTR